MIEELTVTEEERGELPLQTSGELPSADETESSAISESEDCTNEREEQIDYESLIKEDIAQLKSEFKELHRLTDITELDNPLRYAALRDMGLSPREAYLATSRRRQNNTRAHLSAAAPKSASSPGGAMSEVEMASARELFSDMSDDDIRKLYRKVTK